MSDNLQYIEISSVAGKYGLSENEKVVLERINQKIAAGRSLDELMTFLFDSTRGICPCDRIGLAFIEDDGRRVVSRWDRADYAPMILQPGYTEDLAGSSLEKLLKGGQVRIIHDIQRYLAEHPGSKSTKLIVREGVRSSMTCPLTVDDRPIGFLFRSSRKPHSYTEHQVEIHATVAERLSQAVEKAWLIEQLGQANKSYLDMLGFVSHELKNPLSSIIMDASLFSGGFLGAVEPKQLEKVKKISAKAEYLLNLVREYLDLARIEDGMMRLNTRENVNLVGDVLEPAIDIVHSQFELQQQKFEKFYAENLSPVQCDAELLKIVAVNLLANASKYGNRGGIVRLSAEQIDGKSRITVYNEGPGFTPEDRGKLFKKFSRLNAPQHLQKKGTGVGLYTCWKIIQLHGGKIDARSEHGRWAEFWFEIKNKSLSE